ncbi:hypothetical protein EON65_52620 [archaeon]|nr:MAG: hypothetical protein EON65_52620 [archaeon]
MRASWTRPNPLTSRSLISITFLARQRNARDQRKQRLGPVRPCDNWTNSSPSKRNTPILIELKAALANSGRGRPLEQDVLKNICEEISRGALCGLHVPTCVE